MQEDKVFKELEKILENLSIQLKYGRGYFKGGLYRYKGDKYIYLNRTDTKKQQISIILSELEKMKLSGIEIPESIGEIL